MTFFSNSGDKSLTNSDTQISQGILFVKATTYLQAPTDADINLTGSMLILKDPTDHIYGVMLLPLYICMITWMRLHGKILRRGSLSWVPEDLGISSHGTQSSILNSPGKVSH